MHSETELSFTNETDPQHRHLLPKWLFQASLGDKEGKRTLSGSKSCPNPNIHLWDGEKGPFREKILSKSKYTFVGWQDSLTCSADEIPTDTKTDNEPAQKKLGLVR